MVIIPLLLGCFLFWPPGQYPQRWDKLKCKLGMHYPIMPSLTDMYGEPWVNCDTCGKLWPRKEYYK
jgi:hypothetical protein